MLFGQQSGSRSTAWITIQWFKDNQALLPMLIQAHGEDGFGLPGLREGHSLIL